MKNLHKIIALSLLSMALLAACSDDTDKKDSVASPAQPQTLEDRRFNVNRIASGALLFQEHCAQCHGPEAQGHPDWQRAKQEGYVAAPPLDGTGPASLRSQAELVTVIKNGVKYKNEPVMPAWSGRVSDEQVEDVIIWFQALWPGDVYAKWQRKNKGPETRVGANR